MDEAALVDRRQPRRQLAQQTPHHRQSELDPVLEESEQVVLVVVEDKHEVEPASVPAGVNDVPEPDHVRVGAEP